MFRREWLALIGTGGGTTINPCAERLLGLEAESVIGRHYVKLFSRRGSELHSTICSPRRCVRGKRAQR